MRPEWRVQPSVVREAHVIVGTRAGGCGVRPRIVEVVHCIQERVCALQVHSSLNQRQGQGTLHIVPEEQRC